MQTQAKAQYPSIAVFLFSWVVFAAVYIALKSYAPTHNYYGWLLFIASLIIETVVVIFALRLWKQASRESKRIMGYLALSFCFIFISTIIYYLLFNVIRLPHANISNSLLSSYNIPYLGFIFFQFLAWISIFAKSSEANIRKTVYTPVIFIVLACLLMFFLIYAEKNTSGDNIVSGFYTVSDGIFEFGSFVAALLCFATSKNKSILYLSLSYLIVMTTDIVMNFGIFSQHFGVGGFFETFWFLALALRLYSLVLFKNNKSFNTSPNTWLYSMNSIRSQVALWVFTVIIFTVIGFIGVHYLMSPSFFF